MDNKDDNIKTSCLFRRHISANYLLCSPLLKSNDPHRSQTENVHIRHLFNRLSFKRKDKKISLHLPKSIHYCLFCDFHADYSYFQEIRISLINLLRYVGDFQFFHFRIYIIFSRNWEYLEKISQFFPAIVWRSFCKVAHYRHLHCFYLSEANFFLFRYISSKLFT